MKIGIITFHWATNYGAVLQCYALQTYLESQGHKVDIINYKPRQYDDNLWTFIRFRKFRNLKWYRSLQKIESALAEFRTCKLHLTDRIYKCKDVPKTANEYDVIITGSDQVLNPSFLMNGEGRHHFSPTYFIGFPFAGKKMTYAASFGCTTYPKRETSLARNLLSDFFKIGVRENTGVNIVKSMGRTDAVVVPDPTLLLGNRQYIELIPKSNVAVNEPYIYCFFIRNIKERRIAIHSLSLSEKLLWNTDDAKYAIEDWLSKISHADYVITDSFHCVMMCLKLHRPFVVITELDGNQGMNDRLYTILNKLTLGNNIIYKENIRVVSNVISQKIDWNDVDKKLDEIRQVGVDFLKFL